MTQKIELHEGALEVMEAAQFADTTAVSHAVHFDGALCTGCGLCEAFCPMEVIAMEDGRPVAVAEEACWGCETCSGRYEGRRERREEVA